MLRLITSSYLIIISFLALNTVAFAAKITKVQDLSFGAIKASPFGDIILIDASAGESFPVVISGGFSHVTGGMSAKIKVEPDQPGQTIDIVYPVSVTLKSGGNTMELQSMLLNSTPDFVTEDTLPVDINIGGMLTIKNGQPPGSYSETITITINIINP